MKNSSASFEVIFILSLVLALAIGFYAGVELNPKPTQVVIEKTIENKIVEKRIPVEVEVKKHVNKLPNFVRSRGAEVDCAEYTNLVMRGPISNIPIRDKKADPDGREWLSEMGMREASLSLTKSILLIKIQCRIELNKIELETIKNFINREDHETKIKN